MNNNALMKASRSIFALLLAVVMFLGVLPFPAGAASSSEIKKEISALKDEKAIMQQKINEPMPNCFYICASTKFLQSDIRTREISSLYLTILRQDAILFLITHREDLP